MGTIEAPGSARGGQVVEIACISTQRLIASPGARIVSINGVAPWVAHHKRKPVGKASLCAELQSIIMGGQETLDLLDSGRQPAQVGDRRLAVTLGLLVRRLT